MDYVSKGEPIRMWYSNAPYAMCGFYYICNLLKNVSNEIFVVKLPEYVQIDNNITASYQSFGEVMPDKFNMFLRYEKKISQMEKIMFANRWLELVEDNSPLRSVVNGQLIGVSEDFYDYLIYKCLGSEPMGYLQ